MKNQLHMTLFLLFISIALVVALFVFIFFLPSNSPARKTPASRGTSAPARQQIPSSPPQPSVIPDIRSIQLLPTPTATTLTNNNKPAIIKLMPVKTPEYIIEYLVTSDTFIVRVLKTPYQANKTAAENWFKTHGAPNLQTLNILYYRYKFVQD